MRSNALSVVAIGWAVCLTAATSRAQGVTSRSSGWFVGLGVEGEVIGTDQGNGTTKTESGGGGALVVGYGFTPRWSIYSQLSSAVIQADSGKYALLHYDAGARVHFRSGPNAVVPFVQFGISGRRKAQTVQAATGTYDVSASGFGGVLGAGLNAHFNPKLAFSTSVTISVGSFNTFMVDHQKVNLSALNATSTRLHVGLIWFPR